MKTVTADVALLIVSAASSQLLAQTPRATPQPAQDAQAPVRTVERPQGAQRVIHTELRPGLWVHGKPEKPILIGNSFALPEAYDFNPALGR